MLKAAANNTVKVLLRFFICIFIIIL
jgi:hypothetical protein